MGEKVRKGYFPLPLIPSHQGRRDVGNDKFLKGGTGGIAYYNPPTSPWYNIV
jgi:hypothetical protein